MITGSPRSGQFTALARTSTGRTLPGLGRCENRIRTLKHTFWLQLTCVPAGHRAAFWDIKRWRYRVIATAGKLITIGRKQRLLFSGPLAPG
ncbi:hypothetical protein ACX80T_14085 [Arthrobacter sp. Sr33]